MCVVSRLRTIHPMERNFKLLIAYDGGHFHGWQHQPNLDTVQGTLEQSARRVLRHQVDLIGSGRTDAGVHAAGQVANVFTTSTMQATSVRHAMGSRLPKTISLREVVEVSRAFNARRSALSKLYRYRIHSRSARPVVRLQQQCCYHFWHPLDVERMRAGAAHFIGEMDFSAMASAGCVRETMVRTVLRCDIVRHYDEVVIDVEGRGFLYNQVRNMVGTLIEVGRGRWEPERVGDILASRQRSEGGPTAPARGLCLQWVRYPAELLTPERAEGDDEE
ncbi:MAG: tRNA pseudouridine(38-40) synthase TruA [bacterium]|nr:tRNA pseudouridine(38-40) synthase TruA [bacterium]